MNWFDRLKDQALVWSPNMPTSYIENAILRAVSTFFRETHLLKDDVYIDAECNVHDFVLDIPAGRGIEQIKEVRSHANPDKAPLVSREWCEIPPAWERHAPGYWADLSGRRPTIDISDCFALRSGQYAVTYAWFPSGRDCELPFSFIDKYFDALEHGMMSILFRIPLSDESQNFNMARWHEQQFRIAINNAMVEETQNHTNRPLPMVGRSFF